MAYKDYILEDTYCSDELMKLLLEKGCPLEKVVRQDGRPVYYTLPSDHPDWEECDAYYKPTQTSVIRWLRSKGIYIEIDISGHFDIKFTYNIVKKDIGDIYPYTEKYYKMAEEAENDAIIYVLNNIL